MSVATYIPEPIEPPHIEGVDVPAAFWNDCLAYRPKALTRLPLQDRDKLDSETLDYARFLIEGVRFNQNRRYKGTAYALSVVLDLVKRERRQDTTAALERRAYNVEASRRVPCGARKKTGAQCRAMSEVGKNRCKHHGGRSTGPRTLEGKRRALSCLPQYKANPEALEAKLASYAGQFA